MKMYHWNGLPPGGPRLSEIEVDAIHGIAEDAPKAKKDTYFKELPGG
jgi:hypothetical protein